jgi:hypothetical protein
LSLVGVATLVAWVTTEAVSPSSAVQQPDRDAQRLLARAVEWAGGQALQRVQSVSLTGTRGPRGDVPPMRYEVSMLRPDHCQILQEGGWIHTLTGGAFWMTGPPAFAVDSNRGMQATAERSTNRTCLELLTSLFLRVPIERGAVATSVGAVNLVDLKGDGLRVSSPGQDGPVFVFDKSDGRPLGFVTSATALDSTSEPNHVVFQTYATIEGAKFPDFWELRFPDQNAIVEWRVAHVTVNDVTLSQFARKGSSRPRED